MEELKGMFKRNRRDGKVFKILLSGNTKTHFFFFGTDEELDQAIEENKEELMKYCDSSYLGMDIKDIVYVIKDITGKIDLDYRYRG